jgi:basic membrane protein A
VKRIRWSRVLLPLVVVGSLTLAACSSSDNESSGATCKGKTGEKAAAADLGSSDDPQAKDLKVGIVFDIGGKDDKSFNESANIGLEAAEKNMGVKGTALEPAADGSNREQLLRQEADAGNKLIIGVGFNFADTIGAVAKDYPDTKFAIIDSVVEGDNIASVTFAEEQGSYLVGAIAAQKTGTGTIGFVGGVETTLIKKFEAGYVAGAKKVDPKVKVEVKYLTPDGDFSGFNDPAKGKTVAKGLYDAGSDVVYHAAGGSGSGVFEAAVAADKLAIGVDQNQYFQVDAKQQACMLSSMEKRVDVAVYSLIKSLAENKFKTGEVHFDLANGGIDFATTGGQIDDQAAIDDLKQQIIDGKIKVPTTP